MLLTAQAQAAEEADPDKAMALAIEAHGLAPDLVPAAGIAGRILAARGNTQKAAKIIQKTWRKAPHPDLATAYAYARIGDSPRDRLTRIRHLAELNPHSIESPIAVATAAIEAPRLGRRAQGAAAAARRPPDAARVHADGQASRAASRATRAACASGWRAPSMRRAIRPGPPTASSPTPGRRSRRSPAQLDAFQWRVPVESAQAADQSAMLSKVEELVALGASTAPVVEQPVALPQRDETVAKPAPQPRREAAEADVIEMTPKTAEPARAPAPAAAARRVEPAVVAPAATAARTSPDLDEGVLRTVRAASPAPVPPRKSMPAADRSAARARRSRPRRRGPDRAEARLCHALPGGRETA